MYQNGGRLARRGNGGTGLYMRGGGINRYNPCPTPSAPGWGHFITSPAQIDGTINYYCCNEPHRTAECAKVNDKSRLGALRLAEITNFDTLPGR